MNYNMIYAELKKDILEFVKSKIKDVKFVDEILSIYRFKISKPNYENNIESYEQLYRFKKILQLTINAYNNLEVYKDLRVQFSPKECSFFHQNDSWYNLGENNSSWTCLCRPEEHDVVEALYNYLLCFFSIEMHERIAISHIGESINHCPFCDGSIARGEDKCDICDTTIADIRDLRMSDPLRLMVNTSDKNDLRPQRKESTHEMHINDDSFNQKGNNCEMEMTETNECYKKWKCGACAHLNDNGSGNCDACGRWACQQCTFLNSCTEDKCNVCQCMNLKTVESVESKIIGGKGTKESSVVKHRDGYHTLQRNIQNQGKCNQWKCANCTYANKCSIQICEVCGSNNEFLMDECCNDCKINRVTMDELYCQDCCKRKADNDDKHGKWQCSYDICRTWNDSIVSYCQECCLWRHNSVVRGAVVKKMFDKETVDCWICNKCYNVNEISRGVDCETIRCGEKRYNNRYCYHCRLYNPGQHDRCSKCNKIL